MILCKYGCGREGKFPIKCGGFCCRDDYRKCPENKKKYGNSGKKNPMYGKRHSKKTKKLISESKKGSILSEETKQKMKESSRHLSGEKHPMYGKRHSEKTKEKISKSLKGKPSGTAGKPSPMKGKHLSEETKRKLRLSAIKRLENRYGKIYPGYNPKACKIIDEYGKQHDYNFQHAENSGEFHIKELGYWVDGYDKEKNVVIEVDESFHYDSNGNLKERDIQRQKEIENFLKCKFIRIKI